MFDSAKAFSGFSVSDLDAAATFYGETLGLSVERDDMGFLRLALESGATILVYPKEDHTPASYTVLNFGVTDVDAAVDELAARGVDTKIYGDLGDEKGIQREWGPDIAWFRDPAGNVLSVIAVG